VARPQQPQDRRLELGDVGHDLVRRLGVSTRALPAPAAGPELDGRHAGSLGRRDIAVEPVADELIEKITSRMSGLMVGDGTRGCDMGPLITKEHRDKVAGYLDTAEKDGATIVVDGRGISVDGDDAGFWLGPTLIDRVPTTSDVYQHEIFGPVLSMIPFADEDEAVRIANDTPYGLAAYVQSQDLTRARRVARQIRAGSVHLNGAGQDYCSPFGGFKQSGNGREWGEWGLHDFLELKVINGYGA